MKHFITNIINRFKSGDSLVRLLYINVGIFIIVTLIQVAFRLFNFNLAPLFYTFELPASFKQLLVQPWSLLTYMFMHLNVMHILFNMLWFYWFGQLFLYFFSSKHLRGLYFLGGICGGLFFMIAYHIFPYFTSMLNTAKLIGASASIMAIVVATAVREPNYTIRLVLFGNIRLKYMALIFIITDLLFLTSGNGGGHIAHLGGALSGWAFAYFLSKGTDVTAWINKLFDWISSVFSFKNKHKKPKMEVHYSKRQQDYDYNQQKKAASDEIDRILDKLKQSGYGSLSTEEKQKLFEASRRR